jgi:hypothetical protein
VLFKAKEVNLLFFAVPVTPDTLENSGAVMEEVGHNPYLGLRQRDELLVEIGV